MTALFISYSWSDTETASEVVGWLEKAGYDEIIQDRRTDGGVRVGENWERWIYRQLTRCDGVIFLLSATSSTSRWPLSELAVAGALGTPVYPISIGDDVDVDSFFGRTMAVPLSDDGSGVQEVLLASLRRDGLLPQPALKPDQSPFPGLAGFTDDDETVFFGREQETRQLRRILVSQGATGVLVTGPSGVGKSSLVHAGAVPMLRREPGRHILPSMRPGRRPGTGLLGLLGSTLGDGFDPTAHSLDELFDLFRKTHPSVRHLYLVLDQAEQLATVSDEGQAEQFLSLVAEAVAADNLRLIATMRSEYLEAELGTEMRELVEEVVHVDRLDRRGLRRVIERPLRKSEVSLDPEKEGLVDQMLDDTTTGDALPLLAYTLQLMWDERRGNDLTLDDYRRVGGIQGALERRASAALEQAAKGVPSGKAVVLRTLTRLVSFSGRLDQPTSQEIPIDDETARLLGPFVERRLLTTDTANGTATVKVAHEALLRGWEDLRTEIQLQEETIRFRREVELQAARWSRTETLERDDDDLIYGSRLQEATDAFQATMDDQVAEYLSASEEADDRRRRGRSYTRIIQVLGIAAVVLGVFALWQMNVAAENEEAAVRSAEANDALRLAADSARLRDSNLDQSLALALQAVDTQPGLTETRGALLDGIHHAPGPIRFGLESEIVPRGAVVLADEIVGPDLVSGLRLLDPLAPPGNGRQLTVPGQFDVVDIDPTHTHVVGARTADGEPLVFRFDPDTLAPTAQAPLNVAARDLSVSSDGGVAWLDDGGGVWHWPLAGEPALLVENPNGIRLAAMTQGCVAYATPSQVYILSASSSCPFAADTVFDVGASGLAADPSKPELAMAVDGGLIRTVGASSVGEPREIANHGPGVLALRYTATGDELFSGGQDGSIRAWLVIGQTVETRPPLTGHQSAVTRIRADAFSDRVVSADAAGRLIAWDYSTQRHRLMTEHATDDRIGRPVDVLADSGGAAWVRGSRGLQRIRDGHLIESDLLQLPLVTLAGSAEEPALVALNAAAGGEVRSIKLTNGEPVPYPAVPGGAALAGVAASETVAISSQAGVVCTVEPGDQSPNCSQPIQDGDCLLPQGGRLANAVDQAGSVLATGHSNGVVTVHSLPDLDLITCSVDALSSGRANAFRWFPFDGQRLLAVGHDNGTVNVFALEGNGLTLVASLVGHNDSVLAVEHVGDGMLSSAAEDGTVRLWSVSDQTQIGDGFAYQRTGPDQPEILVTSLVHDTDVGLLSVQEGVVTAWDLALDSWVEAGCRLLDDPSQELCGL